MKSFTATAALIAALFAVSTPASADWSPTIATDRAAAKWVQLPDLTSTGMDVLDTIQPNTTPNPQWKTLADDFLCTQSGPVTDAHIWGSWLFDQLPIDPNGLPNPGALQFKISFWTDIQPNAAIPYSHPGTLLWTNVFSPGQFTVNPNVLNAQESFFDPNIGGIIGTDTHVYQYNFPNLVDALGQNFVQTAGTIYWFEVQANVLNVNGAVPASFGWKTADPTILPHTYVPPAQYSFMDDAVFADTLGFNGPNMTFWRDMHYPTGHPYGGQSVDLSFVLTVPEPSTVAMACMGLVALVGMIVRRRRNATLEN